MRNCGFLSIRRLLLLVGLATALFYAGLLAARPLLSATVLRMPENYEYLAQRHAARGEFEAALEACRREISRLTYNFHARFLEAEVLRQAGRPEAALAALEAMPELHRAIIGRTDVPSRGWSEPRLRARLAGVLWDMKRYEEALDAFDLAYDARDPEADEECLAFAARTRSDAGAEARAWACIPEIVLQPKIELNKLPAQWKPLLDKAPVGLFGRLARVAHSRHYPQPMREFYTRELVLHPQALPSLLNYYCYLDAVPAQANAGEAMNRNQLQRALEKATLALARIEFDPQGRYLSNDRRILFMRNVAARATVDLPAPSRAVALMAGGTMCDGIWPVVSIHYQGRRLGWRYIKVSSGFGVFVLPWALPAGSHTFEVVFENDGSNPVSKHDRNADVFEIRFF